MGKDDQIVPNSTSDKSKNKVELKTIEFWAVDQALQPWEVAASKVNNKWVTGQELSKEEFLEAVEAVRNKQA